MLTSPKFLHLVEAVAVIAAKSSIGAVRGTEVCKDMNLPDRYLEAEFQNLVHSGILKSIRGPKGGYVLAKEKRNINLADILQGLAMAEKQRKPSRFGNIVVSRLELVKSDLRKITIHDLLKEASEKGVIDAIPQKVDFAI